MIKTITVELSSMLEEGPILDIMLSVPQHTIVLDDGRQLPASNLSRAIDPIDVKALINTSSQNSMISERIADRLGLTRYGGTTSTNADGQTITYPLVGVTSVIGTRPEEILLHGAAMCMPLTGQLLERQIDFVFGRNFLEHMSFIYLGRENKFTLEFDQPENK